MEKIINGWKHSPGRHCASTAIMDAMNFWGKNLSEAMCFGLGRGLGAFYMTMPGMSPSRWVMTRSADLEKKFFESIGVPFNWKQADNSDAAWAETKKDLDSGKPVLLQTDIHFLPYYNTKTHFNRHAVLQWGYDEARGVGFLCDTEREGLIEAPLDALLKSRNSNFPPGAVKFDWWPVSDPGKLDRIAEEAEQAIKKNAEELANVPENFPLNMGLKALRVLKDELPGWKDSADWSWSSRFAYQAIEKRGTGGSGFRKMYAEFIEEVEDLAPSIKPFGLSKSMRAVAAAWSDLAAALKTVSDMTAPDFTDAAKAAASLYELEKDYCAKAIASM